MRYHPIDNRLFTENRQQFIKHLKAQSIAVFNSNDILPTSADGVRSFIQHSDIFYQSGIDQEESILVIYPDAREAKHREILFIKETNERIATWEGPKHTKEAAQKISGIETIYWSSEFERIFRSFAFEAERIYLNTNEHLRANPEVETRDARFLKECMAAFPLHRYERIAPIMQWIRAIKLPLEIELMKQAVRITENAFRRVLGFIQPGVWEYEIEAEIHHEFIRSRSRRPAYESIIASGANSCILHYVQNDCQCRDGDVVLMDFGAEYANYPADMTRTIPVNGKFSPRQKAVYDAVLRVQKAAKAMLRPGNTLEAYHKEVGKIMECELIQLGLLNSNDVKQQKEESPLYKKYFMHGASHYIGLNVHDLGHTYRKFEAGMVFSCEPGIYIKDEKMGIRLENDILITDEGPVDLMETIPIETKEIEAIMRNKKEQ